MYRIVFTYDGRDRQGTLARRRRDAIIPAGQGGKPPDLAWITEEYEKGVLESLERLPFFVINDIEEASS